MNLTNCYCWSFSSAGWKNDFSSSSKIQGVESQLKEEGRGTLLMPEESFDAAELEAVSNGIEEDGHHHLETSKATRRRDFPHGPVLA